MKPVWEDVNARTYGLRSHLLGPDQLRELGSVAGLKPLVNRLEEGGLHLLLSTEQLTPALVEAEIRREAGRKLLLLARWCGPRREVLPSIFEAEDRRSLRALLRGAAAGVAAETRLQGLIPTPAFPRRALEQLARLPDLRAIGTVLAAWSSPYAAAIRKQEHGIADLFRLELDLAREFLSRAQAASRRGDHFLQAHTRRMTDLENSRSALVLAAESHEHDPDQCFVPGGERITPDRYREAAAAGPSAAVSILARAFGPDVRESAVGRGNTPAGLEDAIVDFLTAEARRAARQFPLSSAPIVLYALALRAEVLSLQRLVWGIALGAPTGGLAS